jgi:hypothetical protein
MEVPAGTINPTTGHVDADDTALFRAIGPDQPDPPSISGTDRTTHVPFGWIRPQGRGMPEPRRYIYGGPPAGPFGPPGGGPPGGGPPRGGPPGGGPFGPPGGGPPRRKTLDRSLRLLQQTVRKHCHGSDGKVPDSAVMTTRAGSILVMDYS